MKKITLLLFASLLCINLSVLNASDKKTIKVFILAGDENILEQGLIEGRTDGVHQDFFTNPEKTKGEKQKHVNATVYKGVYSAKVDYDSLTPEATAVVEIGEQRTRRLSSKKRGREPVPMAPFPEQSRKDGYTTVIRGYVSVKFPGKYEFHPGKDESSFNLTTLEGKEVYRRNVGEEKAKLTPFELKPGKRYAFRTIFFKKPGHEFRLPLLNKQGSLDWAVAGNTDYAFLKNKNRKWVTRDDVILYDAHPIHNNTKTVGHYLKVGDVVYGGAKPSGFIGIEQTLGHILGDYYEEPVMLVRFGTRHPIWFQRGSRSLGHDYKPPSSGGTNDLDGTWDVIHFNWGVWDSQYREKNFKFYEGEGKHPTSYADWEKNLRTLVARMKKTGATLIWGSVTPVWKGEPGKPNADVKKYNEIAEKVMKENGVIIDDLHSESLRMGYPKTTNVHSVGNLAPKVTKTVLNALKDRKQNTKPLPRVLLIGDSITGSYIKQVMKNLDGKAFVCKNPGNAESTWNGLRRIDNWVDLKQYLLNGQEYLELVNSVKDTVNDLKRFFPGYQGQGAELAGLVWFQGIKDTESDSMSADYEKNLANLIRDLRRDLKSPELPVVVPAIGIGGEKMRARVKSVFDAEMTVGNPEKYPEFAGNVKSIDTRGFFPKPEESPGGREQVYGNSAKSFLEIGKASGAAMLKLIKEKQDQ